MMVVAKVSRGRILFRLPFTAACAGFFILSRSGDRKPSELFYTDSSRK